MYRHPETKEEQYPITPRENLHHSLKLLAQEFPGRSVKASEYEVPAFSWNGAGSESGGSAEHIRYDTILFLPAEKKDMIAVSVGDRSKEWYKQKVGMVLDDSYGAQPIYKDYSVLLLQKIPEDAACRIVDQYLENVAGNEGSGKADNFSMAMHKLLDGGTSYFWKLPLFAYDMEGLFVKSRRFDPNRTKLLKKVDSLGSAESIAQAITKYAQGKAHETPFAHFARHYDDYLHQYTMESILKLLTKA